MDYVNCGTKIYLNWQKYKKLSKYNTMNNSLDFKMIKKINFINFNQDRSCFCIGTDEGYEIYNCDPFKKIFSKKIGKFGISYVAMLFRTNIFALVLKNTLSKNNENKLLLWDDSKNSKIGEIEFSKNIRNVKLRKDSITVSTNTNVYLYNIFNFKLLKKINTITNHKGLVEITYFKHKFILACVGEEIGELRCFDMLENKSLRINAHKSMINFITLSGPGNLVATSSVKGTIIRVFHILTGQLVKELRRGSDKTIINWIEFNHGEEMILCRSRKGTIHIFNTDYKKNSLNKKNKFLSIGKYFNNFLPKYFNSEWSFVHLHFPNKRTISTFLNDSKHIIIISFESIYYKINFTDKKYVTVLKKHL